MKPHTPVSEQKAARSFFADRLEAHFRSHPLEWISILDLMPIGGPSWRSRIADELRGQRKMNVEWNGNSRQSMYRFIPYEPLGRDAGEQVPAQLEMLR